MTGQAPAVPMTEPQAQAYVALAVFAYVGLALLVAIAVHRTIRQARERGRVVDTSPPPAAAAAADLNAALDRRPRLDLTDTRGLLVDRYM